MQDWYLRYALTAVPGVSEVASVGGFEKQYQVDIDPAKLLAYGIPVTRVMSAIQIAEQRRRRDGRWSCPSASTWCAGSGT